ncbi:MAG: MerR family transcriptional regulator [Prevotella sp.]|nr:MerR family transcriptional regulator [Prevotella sp.]MDT3388277.1 MerR family transcriptional regulator [Bacteroidota bacterium]
MKEIKYKIGEISTLARVTVRTLRHYEEIDLLKPDIIDMWTGYRYYSAANLQKLLSILKLKDLGFTLSEIRELYDEETHSPGIDAIEAKISECEQQIEAFHQRRLHLLSLLSSLKKKQRMEKIYFDALPEIIVASNRTTLNSYDELGRHLVNVVGPEMARLGCVCPEPGYCFTTELADEYKENNFEIEYCEQVKQMGKDSDIVKFKKLEAVPTAICMKVYGPYSILRDSYLELFEEIAKLGYQIAGAPRANYVDGIWNQEDSAKWLTIIQVPIVKP